MLLALQDLKKFDHEIILLSHACDLLRWDQETYMPPAAIEERALQISLLQGLIHSRIVDKKQEELFASLGVSAQNPEGPDTLSDETKAFLRESFRRYAKHTKVPQSLVEEIARKQSIAQAAWVEAKKESAYNLFKPHLQELIHLMRNYAECQGYTEHIYDALLDEYEPYFKASQLELLFEPLEKELKQLIEKILGSNQKPNSSILSRRVPIESQKAFNQKILAALGFDFKAGRIDVSAHPFTTTLGACDVRLTTRYNENYFPASIFGTIHEAGHGLYEQGFASELRGSILANAPSLGFHESQSRLWENLVGKSWSFWNYFFPLLKELSPQSFENVSLDEFYLAINRVKPSLIRIEADEVTYNLHIILRFKLEKKLLADDLTVSDLPLAWNELSNELLGLKPNNDAEGVLQDVHWSMGAFGYFPTYSLGNLLSAQLFSKLTKEYPEYEKKISRGELNFIREWLQEKIHQFGAIYPTQELLKKITAQSLDPSFFINYIKQKYGAIYGF